MVVLWVSDSPTSPSGFGVVTRAVCSRLARAGHRVEIVGWQARGATSYWQGIPVHPVRYDTFGADVLLSYMMRCRPNFVVTLADVWWMSFMTDPGVQRYLDQSGCRWVLYYPVDGADPDGRLPPSWQRMLSAADVPIAMSKYGVEVSRASGIEPAYIPHGCDLEVFAPPEDKAAAKSALGYQGKFVVLSDARNQPRKQLPRLLDVAAAFCAGKTDVVFHLHTDPDDDSCRSELYIYRLRKDVERLGLADHVRFTPTFQMRDGGGLADSDLARIYQAADVHLLCSYGEGFGLPTLQAAAAGVVPMAVAYSASLELVAGHGFAVRQESSTTDVFGLVRSLLDREDAVSALERLYSDPEELKARSRQSRAFAECYSWEQIARSWDEVLRSAPPRRRPSVRRQWAFEPGQRAGDSTMPEALQSQLSKAFARVPGGATLTVGVAERRAGEIAADIRRSAFVHGDELSIPVRLPPLLSDLPKARIGWVLATAAEAEVLGRLKEVFPGLTIALPIEGSPDDGRRLSLEELLPSLAHYSLVVDYDRLGPDHLDAACAALGVPFAGASDLWPRIELETRFLQLRRLLTDQGLSQTRRSTAVQLVVERLGIEYVASLRRAAIPAPSQRARQPEVALR